MNLDARALRRYIEDPHFNYIANPLQGNALHAHLTEIVADGEKTIAIDTETTGLSFVDHRIRLLTIGSTKRCVVIDCDAFRDSATGEIDWSMPGLSNVAKILKDNSVAKILHNAMFDYNMLAASGLFIRGPIFDTLIASKIINNGSGAKNDLGAVVKRLLDLTIEKESQTSDWSASTLTVEQLKYAARDVLVLPYCKELLEQNLVESKISDRVTLMDIAKLEFKCIEAISRMSLYGMGFDDDAAAALEEELKAEDEAKKVAFCESLDKAIRARHKDSTMWLPREADGSINTREKTSGSIRLGTKVYAGFNPRSTQQMVEGFKRAGVKLPPAEKGKTSLDQKLLAFVKHQIPLVAEYMAWREVATRVSDVQKLRRAYSHKTMRIHAGYRQVGTDTGRLSCAEPNLQNVPRSAKFRRLFTAAPGYSILDADFSQIELRAVADISGEPRLIEAYLAGRDLHTETAALIAECSHEEVTKEQRLAGKIANFALLYGAGAATLRKQAVSQFDLDMSLSEARDIVEGFRKAYPTLYRWQTKEGNATTAAVFSRYGRRRLLVGFNDRFTIRLNTRVQSTAGDIAKIAIALLWQTLRDTPISEARLIGMVHDELIMEVKQGYEAVWAQRLTEAMEKAGSLVLSTVPVKADAAWGPNWAEAK